MFFVNAAAFRGANLSEACQLPGFEKQLEDLPKRDYR